MKDDILNTPISTVALQQVSSQTLGPVKLVRLLSGEELVGHVTQNADGVKIERALILIIQPPMKQGDKAAIGFGPWLPYVEKKNGVNINAASIVLIADPVDGLKDAFIQTTTGIAPVRKPGIIMP